MLTIVIPAVERFNEATGMFEYGEETTLHLEHSLVSIAKWEAKWNVPFLSKQEKTTEQVLHYIECMTLDEDVNREIYSNITNENVMAVSEYIDAPMTATTFNDTNKKPPSREIVTSEIIYYWMIGQNIPMECQYWHLNRLMTLIRVCDIKNNPPKKMSKSELAQRNRALNEARKKKMNTKG